MKGSFLLFKVACCRLARVGEETISLGSIVRFEGEGQLGLVQAMWQDKSDKQWVQVRGVLHGQETVLGDAAAKDELFVISQTFKR